MIELQWLISSHSIQLINISKWGLMLFVKYRLIVVIRIVSAWHSSLMWHHLTSAIIRLFFCWVETKFPCPHSEITHFDVQLFIELTSIPLKYQRPDTVIKMLNTARSSSNKPSNSLIICRQFVRNSLQRSTAYCMDNPSVSGTVHKTRKFTRRLNLSSSSLIQKWYFRCHRRNFPFNGRNAIFHKRNIMFHGLDDFKSLNFILFQVGHAGEKPLLYRPWWFVDTQQWKQKPVWIASRSVTIVGEDMAFVSVLHPHRPRTGDLKVPSYSLLKRNLASYYLILHQSQHFR